MPTSPPDTGDAAPRRIRKLWIVLAALLGLAVVVRVALPYAIQWGVGWGAMRQLGYAAHLENIDLSFFKGTLRLEGLVMAQGDNPPPEGEPPNSERALIVLDQVFVDFSWLDLFKGMFHITRIDVDGPRVTVERLADGRIDPLGQGPGPPGKSDEPEATPEAEATPEMAPEDAPDAGTDEAVGAEDAESGWPVVVDVLDLEQAFIHVRDKVDGTELAAFDVAELILKDVRVEGSGFGLGGLSVTRPTVRIQREFALDPAGGRSPEAAAPEVDAAPGEAAPDEAEPDAARSFRLEDLDIERAGFSLLVGDRELAIALRLKADGVSLDPGSTFPMSLGVDIEDGKIEIDGTAGALPPFFDGTIKVTQLPLPLITLLTRPEALEWFKSTRIAADLKVLARPAVVEGSSEIPEVRVDGTFQLSELDFSDPGGDAIRFAWNSLDVELKEVVLPMGDAAVTTPMQVKLGRVALSNPQILYTLPSSALDALLAGRPAEAESEEEAPADAAEEAPAEEAPEQEPTPAGPPPEISIARFELRGGGVRFNDNTVQPAYRGVIDKLEVTADGIDPLAPSVQKLVVDARLPGGSRLDIDGRIGATDGKLRLDVKRLTLPPMNPYARGAGLELEEGGLSLGADIQAEGAHWNIESDVTLHDLSLDSEGSKEFVDQLGMPIDLILSVLRSPAGDISIPVNVEFDETGAGVDITAIIMGALRQALVGAATIPLKALGGIFGAIGGGGGVSFEPLAAIPGTADAAPGAVERLDGLVELLESSPTLVVRLDGQAGDADVPFLAEAELADQIAAGGDLPELRDDQAAGLLGRGRIKRALKKRAKGQPIDLKEEDAVHLRRYVAQIAVPDERYDDLGRRRAKAAQQYILDTERVDAARVQLEPPSRGTPGVHFKFTSLE